MDFTAKSVRREIKIKIKIIQYFLSILISLTSYLLNRSQKSRLHLSQGYLCWPYHDPEFVINEIIKMRKRFLNGMSIHLH